MSPEAFLKEFGHLAETQGGLRQLRSLLRLLAVTGRLSEREPGDESLEQTLAHAGSLKPQEGTRGRSRGSGSEPVTVRPSVPLPSHWAWTKFVDVAVIQSNLVPPSKYFSHPHVAPDNIEKETGRLLDYRSISEDGVRSSKHLFYPGQILYSKIRPNLSKAVAVDFEGLCSADMYPLLPLIDRRYLLLFILSEPFLKQVVVNDNRVAMPKVNQEQLSEAWVAVPPLPEQKRIVEKVDQLMALCDELEAKQKQKREKAVSLNKAALSAVIHAPDKSRLKSSWSRVQDHFEVLYELPENVKELRQTILQLAVMGKLVRQEAADGDGHSLAEKILAERSELLQSGAIPKTQMPKMDTIELDILRFPACWAVGILDQVAYVVDPNPSHRNPQYVERGFPFISTQEFYGSEGVILDTPRRVSEKTVVEQEERCRFNGRSIAFSRKGTIGKTRLLPSGVRFALLDSLCVVNPYSGVNEKYLNLCLRSPLLCDQLRGQTRGLALPQVSVGRVRQLRVPLPPVGEQIRIAQLVERFTILCDDLEAKLAQHRDQGQRLMRAVVEGLVA